MKDNLFFPIQGGRKGAILALVLLPLFSCTNNKKTDVQEIAPAEQLVHEVQSLPNYTYTDSLMQGSHKVVYTITSEADENLPEIVDEDGVKYKDNRFTLIITKDGETLFKRSFSKADFCNQLSKDFQKYSIMDGMRFSHAEEGKLYFNTCVSLPDSDMSCPFILAIGPDGSYTIEPDTSIDEDALPTPISSSI